MNSEIDDPILTAYALGELDAAERAAVEARLQKDAAARQFVEETRAFAQQLGSTLQQTPAADLTDAQKAAILAEASDPKPAPGKIVPFLRWAVPLSAAAAITAACIVALRQGAPPKLEKDYAPLLAANVPAKSAATPDARSQSLLTKEFVAKQLATGSSAALATTAPSTAPALSASALRLPAAEPVEANEKDQVVGRVINPPTTSAAADKKSASTMLAQSGVTGDIGPSPVIAYFSRGLIVENQTAGMDGSDATSEMHAPLNARAPQTPLPEEKPASTSVSGSAGVIVTGPVGGESYNKTSSRLVQQLQDGDQSKIERSKLLTGLKAKQPPRDRFDALAADDPGVPGLPQREAGNTEAYDRITDHEFIRVTAGSESNLSTFSIDVDTASYANTRRFLEGGNLPPKDSVRIEELLNYFDYDYPQPTGDDPFSVNVEVAPAPWNAKHLLAKIGLKGRVIPPEKRAPLNLVFLLDVSGSMDEPNKLPLVRQAMKMLVAKLNPTDRVAIVVYAEASGLALPSTEVSHQKEIASAIDTLRAGGSTNGAAGIQLAYDIAKANFIENGANRVVLCTDGDFNVGVTNQGDLLRLIEEKAKSKVFLTVLGFGMGNYKDSTLEKLADKGNGNYGYIDTEKEAKKMLVDQLSGTLVTIAKDVKIQVEFNPAQVGAYRLIGYENRLLAARDFNDDKKDAGEIGAGHTVTALYELTPARETSGLPEVDPLKYQPTDQPQDKSTPATASNELMTVKLRYKQPTGDVSKLIEKPVPFQLQAAYVMPKDFQFAAAVAEFGMLLRESPYKGDTTWKSAADLAENGLGPDAQGYRHEFLKLIQRAQRLTEPQPTPATTPAPTR